MHTVLDQAMQHGVDLPEVDLIPSTFLPSAAVDVTHVLALAEQAEHLVQGGAAGIVVTTGTDTLEEVAFLLDLVWSKDEPLVVSGAMVHGGLPASDGPANLRDSLRVAAHPQAKGQGVLVTMGGSVHHAWQVRKAHTGLQPGFQSPVSGPCGLVQEEVVRFFGSDVIDRPLLQPPAPAAVPPVALIMTALGDDGRVLSTIPDLGYRGLVIAAMGGGSIPPAWAPQLEELCRVMPTVYSPRTFGGPTLRSTYGGVGTELDLRRMGVLPTGLLDALKSRLLLGLLIAVGASPEVTAAAFAMFDQPVSTGHRKL